MEKASFDPSTPDSDHNLSFMDDMPTKTNLIIFLKTESFKNAQLFVCKK